MAVIDDLERRVRSAAAALPATYRRAAAVGKVYEAYCWTLAIEAAMLRGSRPVARRLSGTRIVLPGSPVTLNRSYRWTYAEFGADGFEIHAGVKAIGRSAIAHELDVSALDADACARARQVTRPVAIRSHHALVAVEAKCYDNGLGLSIGREVLGLNSDTYCPILLATNTFDASVERMLDSRTTKSRIIGGVRPAAPLRERAAYAAIAAAL